MFDKCKTCMCDECLVCDNYVALFANPATGRALDIETQKDTDVSHIINILLSLADDGTLARISSDLDAIILKRKYDTKRKAMLSQPMGGKSEDEIKATRDRAIKVLTDKGYEIVNTLFTDEWYNTENMKARGVVQIPLCFLAKSLENMSKCHAVYFCKGWKNARGCRIEHDAAKAYGLEILYEE